MARCRTEEQGERTRLISNHSKIVQLVEVRTALAVCVDPSRVRRRSFGCYGNSNQIETQVIGLVWPYDMSVEKTGISLGI